MGLFIDVGHELFKQRKLSQNKTKQKSSKFDESHSFS